MICQTSSTYLIGLVTFFQLYPCLMMTCLDVHNIPVSKKRCRHGHVKSINDGQCRTQWNSGKMSLGKRFTQFRLLTFKVFSFPVLLGGLKHAMLL